MLCGALYSFEFAVNLIGANKVRPPKNFLVAAGHRFKQIRYSQVPVTTTLPVTPRNGFFGPCSWYMNHKEKLFQSDSEVGIYMQIPLYNINLEQAAESWFHVLENAPCKINTENILLLNNPNDWQTFFEARHSIPANALEKTHRLDTWSILTDTIVPPENFQQFLDVSHELIQKSGIEYLLFGHLGDCHLHFHLIPTKDQQSKALDVYQNIVKKSANLGGVYSAEHGTGKRKRNDFIECFGDIGVKQLWKSKSAVDPHFLLNKGNVIES